MRVRLPRSRLGALDQAAQHASEDEPVHGIEAVPVDQPPKPARIEQRGLPHDAARALRIHIELQSSPPGQFHLGLKP